jgi:hypothetical protein
MPTRGKKGQYHVDTNYSAYKLDLMGTNNRAVVLKLDDVLGLPVYALAAIYDHNHDKKINSVIDIK